MVNNKHLLSDNLVTVYPSDHQIPFYHNRIKFQPGYGNPKDPYRPSSRHHKTGSNMLLNLHLGIY